MDSINDIISSLSADDIENLKAAAESFFGSKEEKPNSALPLPPISQNVVTKRTFR